MLSADLVSKAAFASISAGGDMRALSADGRYVVFTSDAESIIGFTIAPGVANVYRFDRVTGDVVLVSVDSAGTGSGNSTSDSPVISADGSVVAFRSVATNLSPLDHDSGADIYARNLITGTTYLVSINAAGTASGNGVSDSAVVSADGSVVAFRSVASNLHPLDGGSQSDIFARHLLTGTTNLISINAAGTASANNTSDSPVISADGNVIAFRSTASDLHALDTSTGSDIFARNLTAGTTALVSVSKTGTSGSGSSDHPVISADGNVVAFQSYSSILHPLHSSIYQDIFARNLATGTTYLVSINTAGTGGANQYCDTPVINADGSVVAFQSLASNLHPLDSVISFQDVFARNVITGTTYLVSVNSIGTAGGSGTSFGPTISGDGKVVAFTSTATLKPLPANSGLNVFARNLSAGTTSQVSVNSAGTAGGNSDSYNESYVPAISADGSVIAFGSIANDLVDGGLTNGDFNGRVDVFVRDLATGVTQLASALKLDQSSSTASSESTIGAGAVSANGRYVVFVSKAGNLIDGMNFAPGSQNVYRQDRLTGHIDLVSISASGTSGGNGSSYDPVISGDGNVVAFRSTARNLNALKTDIDSDIFVRKLTSGTTYLASVNTAGTGSANRDAYGPVLSADGSVVAFYSQASNLHLLDTNSTSDIFARNIVASATYLVSASANGNGSGNGPSDDPVISADGKLVAFRSNASNLHPAKTTTARSDVFARNMETGNLYLVSVNPAGSISGDADSFDPVISANGSVVAFRSAAANLNPLKTNIGRFDVFARNIVTGATSLISVSEDGTSGGTSDSDQPAISADGNVVAFRSAAINLHVAKTAGTSADIFARNIAAGTTYLVSINAAGDGAGDGESVDPVMSADGSVVVFRSTADNLSVLKNTGSYHDVFSRNLITGLTSLLSVNSTQPASGNLHSEHAAVSADGRTVAFDSKATNFVEGDFNSSADVFIGTTPGSQVLGGDYNQSAVADAGDYVLWRKTAGATGLAPFTRADGSGDASVGAEDYEVWRSHFGGTSGSGAGTKVSLGELAANELVDVMLLAEGASDDSDTEVGAAAIGVPVFFDSRKLSSSAKLRSSTRGASERRHDDALLAWLSSRRADDAAGQSGTAVLGLGQSSSDDAVDGAFGELGVPVCGGVGREL